MREGGGAAFLIAQPPFIPLLPMRLNRNVPTVDVLPPAPRRLPSCLCDSTHGGHHAGSTTPRPVHPPVTPLTVVIMQVAPLPSQSAVKAHLKQRLRQVKGGGVYRETYTAAEEGL